MSRLVTLATCNLNQWALDFDGNLERVVLSIKEAKKKGAKYRLGPELELCGYGCEDHFLEQSLAVILSGDLTDDILCDIGMPVFHNGVRYNCRVLCCNRKVVWIRPKLYMADDGNYRETRWFTPWKEMRPDYSLQEHTLDPMIREVTGQRTVPFGWGALHLNDTIFAPETCEELFTPASPHIDLGLAGVEIFGNGSGSHHQLRKLHTRVELMRSAMAKSGGVYLYANQQGCDGGRLYYDGCAVIVVNGKVVAQGAQFSVADVEVITATVDLGDVRSFRGAFSSRSRQAAQKASAVPHVELNFSLSLPEDDGTLQPNPPMEVKYHMPEEEIGYGPACWLWDYLRRSGASGFFLPLSGGADSSSVAALVGVMCNLVCESARKGNMQTIKDARRVTGEPEDSSYVPSDPVELASRILHTAYLGTENSSAATENRAKKTAKEIGAYHLTFKIDAIVQAILGVFSLVTGKLPNFAIQGGTMTEDLALQNIQARLRMVVSFLLAQLLPWVRGKRGFLLVLSSANVDEALRGYMTKYDCSSGDLNPIGAISKGDLKRFLKWCGKKFNYPTLLEVEAAPPTAELRPQIGDSKHNSEVEHSQLDEDEMGMSYAELGVFGRLRKMKRCGPVTMYQKLLGEWNHLEPEEVAVKVKRFFYYYSVNRHKMTTLTPSYHAEEYSPDDNRFDLRQFLYNVKWQRQFDEIDKLAARASKRRASGKSLKPTQEGQA